MPLAVEPVLDDAVAVPVPEHGSARDAAEAVRVEEGVVGADALLGHVPSAADASVDPPPPNVAVLAEDDAVVLAESRLLGGNSIGFFRPRKTAPISCTKPV